ncbi:MAG: TonB-dependent receptor [Bacteroidales bacterium]|nr:TonB-dependent receptor [Bacteroidales bacterium]
MKAKVFLFFMLFLFVKVNAQNSISGLVTDVKAGGSLPGVNIVVADLSVGAVSNAQGHYTIGNLPNGQFFVTYSYVGYENITKEVHLTGNTHITLNIGLNPQVIEGQEVVVTGSFTGTQHENTVQINSVNAQSLNQVGSPSLMASLAQIPNVDVISKGPGVVTPVIRGMSLSNILVLNNGIPMENFQFSEEHPYMVDASGVNRIEVIKGPASLMYGSGAVGGVINLIGEPVADRGTIEGSANLRYYSNTMGTNSDIGIKGNENGFVWGARAGLNSQADFIQGNGKFAPNTRFNTQSAKLNAGFIKKIGTFRLFYNYDRDKLGMAVPPALALVTERGRKNKVWYQNLTNNLLISKNKIFLGDFKLDADFSYQNNNRRLEGSPDSPPFELVNMTLQTFTYRMKGVYNFSDKFKAFLGIQGLSQNNRNHQAPQHVIPNASQNDFSIFSMGRYHWNKNIVTEAGVRFDHRKIFIPAYTSNGSPVPDMTRTYDNVSASLGTNVPLAENLLLRLNVASAFRSPNIAELTQDGVHGARYEKGNSNLKNQQNTEADLGLHFHTLHTTFEVSAFYNHINNYIYLSPTDNYTNGYRIYQYMQTPSELYGGEVGFHIHPHPLDWLHLSANYSYILGKVISGGYLPLIPANKIHFEVMLTQNKWHQFRDSFFKIETNYAFAQNHPSEFENTSKAYTLFNLVMGTQFKMGSQLVSLNVIANNLFNVTYVDHLSTLQEVGLYNAGRNITVSLHIPFGIAQGKQ